MKESFILYTDYREVIEQMDMNDRGELLTAIMRYASDEDPGELSPLVNVVFAFIRSRMDRDAAKYEQTCEKRRIAASMGGKQKLANASKWKQMEANGSKSKQKLHDNDNDNEHDNDNVHVIKLSRERPRFTPPTVEEVAEYAREYAKEKGLPEIHAEDFVDFYASKNWMIGREKMKDWRAAVRRWTRDDATRGKKKRSWERSGNLDAMLDSFGNL